MRIWDRIVETLTRDPRSFNADGRPMGLGLALAMEQAEKNQTASVEEFLRHQAPEPQRTP